MLHREPFKRKHVHQWRIDNRKTKWADGETLALVRECDCGKKMVAWVKADMMHTLPSNEILLAIGDFEWQELT